MMSGQIQISLVREAYELINALSKLIELLPGHQILHSIPYLTGCHL